MQTIYFQYSTLSGLPMFRQKGSHHTGDNRMSYAESIVGLIGHLLGTGAIFVSLLLIGLFLLAFLARNTPFPQ
jgi:hypothetical protein